MGKTIKMCHFRLFFVIFLFFKMEFCAGLRRYFGPSLSKQKQDDMTHANLRVLKDTLPFFACIPNPVTAAFINDPQRHFKMMQKMNGSKLDFFWTLLVGEEASFYLYHCGEFTAIPYTVVPGTEWKKFCGDFCHIKMDQKMGDTKALVACFPDHNRNLNDLHNRSHDEDLDLYYELCKTDTPEKFKVVVVPVYYENQTVLFAKTYLDKDPIVPSNFQRDINQWRDLIELPCTCYTYTPVLHLTLYPYVPPELEPSLKLVGVAGEEDKKTDTMKEFSGNLKSLFS